MLRCRLGGRRWEWRCLLARGRRRHAGGQGHLVAFVAVRIVTRTASTDNQGGGLAGSHFDLNAFVCLSEQLHNAYVVLLSGASLSVICCCCLKLDTFKSDDALVSTDGA